MQLIRQTPAGSAKTVREVKGMRFFGVRLILALFVGITLVSLGSAYFEVLAHKLSLRRELQRRTIWLATSLQLDLEPGLANGQIGNLADQIERLRARDEALALAVYDVHGAVLATAGPVELFKELPQAVLAKAIQKGANSGAVAV